MPLWQWSIPRCQAYQVFLIVEQTLRAENGAGLRYRLDDAILQGLTQALSKVDQRHATAVLCAGFRAGYRSGQRTVRISGPLGVMKVSLVISRKGLSRPVFFKDAAHFTTGVKQLAVRLWSHGLSHRSIATLSAEALKSEVGRTTVGT